MERKPYSAGAVKFSFWFMEFRKTVQLLSEGKSFADIKKLNEETNIYGAPTKLRAQQIYSTVTARIKTLDESFYPIFLSSDLATQKLFVLTAALLHDTLFFDFVYEVVREKMDGAEHCNNVSTLRSYADKAEALKLRLLNEMNAEDIRLAKEAAAKAEAERKRQEEEAEKRGETVKPAEKVAEPQPVYKVRTTKNVSIKTVAKTASWRLESKDDVDKYLAALRENLLKEMDEDTIVNIEL